MHNKTIEKILIIVVCVGLMCYGFGDILTWLDMPFEKSFLGLLFTHSLCFMLGMIVHNVNLGG